VADQQHKLCQWLADEGGEPPGRPGAGQDAEIWLRIAELRGRAGHPDVARVCELGAAAKRIAVDCGDGRHWQLVAAHTRKGRGRG
jgi:hypothetical protein